MSAATAGACTLVAFGRPLVLARPPLCPEIALWLLAPEIDLEAQCRSLADCDPPPFWAFCWASGQALARQILDHPEWVRGQTVVDFGAGCGVAAIAAARAGASRVVAVDLDPDARAAAQWNAATNGVAVEVAERMPAEFDVLLASDVLYEPTNFEWLLGWAARGRRLLVSDPERPAAPRLPGHPLARVEARTLPDVDPPMQSAAIYALPPLEGPTRA